MSRAHIIFKKNIEEAKQLNALHTYLSNNIQVPMSHDDILRAQLVNCVSAFDKLIHDLILDGLTDMYVGKRQQTPKFLGEVLPLNVYFKLQNATMPPPEYHFREAMRAKLKTISYQEPSKVAEGLAYIWDEGQKWVKIAQVMGSKDDLVKKQLKLIAVRRNAIVHEADLDPVTHQKLSIDSRMVTDSSNFLEQCGDAIESLVS
ncbi:HEPN domain-containing protein [Escherichia marmotae]|uniref:HEPN domain-containing protein n=1 Tax=Escherichia marmotae TaxID=1499973 RepID=UPI0015F17A8E|nr:HEPN domain-containing protein [Escherichia marmotae]MBA7739946.1 hypothetical protein [Escherichia marmotae]MBA7954079.1 hypothetical protein [Escherichia marmotae]MED9363111.1 HEPN domain-containing protein [Escherichia marmotae]MED9495204.1 HEPN domain-containing protein [Escherichia marmotae]MED9520757.1 HEPN domain-containing protein [Escherichia marmotae]